MLHVPTAHWPATHEGVPFVAVQTVPQPPQCDVFVTKFASQPLRSLASQLPKLVAHPARVHLTKTFEAFEAAIVPVPWTTVQI